MAFTYDIEKDLRFQEGERRGELKGEIKGEKRGEIKGELKAKTQAVKTMLKNGLAIKDIANYLGVSVEFIEDVQKDNK